MRIGIDIDDTITDTYFELLREIANFYNKDEKDLIRNKYSYDHFFINKEEYPNFQLNMGIFFDRLIPKLKLKEGAKEVINRLKEEGHDIIFITARRNKKAGITNEFLERNSIPYDKIYERINDKGEIAKLENIDLFIDDSIDHCEQVNDRGIRAILFDAVYNRKECEFKRVKSWNEIYGIINE